MIFWEDVPSALVPLLPPIALVLLTTTWLAARRRSGAGARTPYLWTALQAGLLTALLLVLWAAFTPRPKLPAWFALGFATGALCGLLAEGIARLLTPRR